MAEKLQFQIEFELAQQALREIRAQLKRQLSNIQATIEPRVQRAVTRGTQSQISNVSGEISQEVERLQKTQAAALQKLNSAQERLSVATQRAAQITEAGANITDQERRELITLNRSVGQLKRSVRESFDEFVNLNPVIGNLKAAIQESVGAFTNLELGQESELNNLFIELSASVNAASDEFQKIIAGGRALNVNTVLDRFGSRIERDVLPAFESLGLTAQQQEGFVRQAISSLAQKIEDAGFTLPEGEFDVLGTESRNLSAQERNLNSAVQRLRNVTRARVRTIEEGIAREREGRAVGDASVRIQEQASQATNELAQSFRDRAKSIRLLSFDEILSPRLVEFANRLEISATDLQLASRPIIAVGERANELAIRFGGVTREVAEGLFPRATRKQLITASDSLRQSIAENEGNIDKGVEAFVASLSGLETTEENVKKTLGLLDAALKKEAAATIDLANSEKQRADSLRGQASKSLQQTARLDLSSAQAEITRSAKDLVRDLRGAGKEAAQLRQDGTFSNFQQQLGAVQARFFAALDPGQLSFLQSTGVDIDSIIRDALAKVTQNFTSEFNRETSRITKILLDEATRGARELASGLGRAGQEAGALLDPGFLEESIGQITSEFPNLTEQIVEDIVKPLRRQIERAAESRQKTDSKIQSIRDKQANAQEELLNRINSSFQAQQLEGALGGGVLESAGRSLANAFSSAAGRIQNAFSLSERQALQDTQRRREINSAVIQAHNNEIAAIEGEIEAVRSQESTNENFARNLRVAARALQSRNSNLIQELSELEGAIQRAELGFEGFDNLANLRQKQQELARQQVTTQQQILNIQIDEARALSESEQQSESVVQKQNIILSLQSDIITAEKNLAEATQEAANIQNRRNQRVSTGTDNRVGGTGPLQQFDVQSLQDFGQKLDISAQERFVKILKNEDASLKTVNTQLKAHQGNINKSNDLVKRLTITMSSGQKAAFQFGFAAANAADRLLAWASPAAFIFKAIGSLREAVQTIIRIDETVARIAFFNPDSLDRAAASVTNLGGALRNVGEGAAFTTGAFNRLNDVTERFIALTRAAATTQTLLIQRSRETGIEIDRLSQIVLIAGRVNREAFAATGEINPFAEAVEGLLRLEGPLGNAEKLTADLNSVLNQFKVSGDAAVLVAAQIAEVSQRSAFGAGELAEALTRIGGAFSAIQGATFAESLEFISAASNAAQTSVSRVGTSLRQLSIGVARSADEIREFSGLDIVSEGQLRGPQALVDVLKVINSFQGEQAAIDFISEFTDERNASVILGLARNIDVVEESLQSLGDEAERETKQIQTLERFFSEIEAQTRTTSSEINKLRASLEGLVSDSGTEDFLAGLVRATNFFVSGLSLATTALGGLAPIFAATFGLLVPTLRAVAAGFVAGLLPQQKLAEVQSQIAVKLFEEKALIEATNIARAEGLLTETQAAAFREKGFAIVTATAVAEDRLRTIKLQIAVLDDEAGADKRQLLALTKEQTALEKQIRNLKLQQGTLQGNINKGVTASATGTGAIFSDRSISRFKTIFGAAILAGGIFAAPKIGEAIGGEVGREVTSALQFAVGGLAIGSILGVGGAIFGVAAGALTGLITQRARAQEQAVKEEEIQLKINKAIADQRKQTAAADAESSENQAKISERKNLELQLTKDLVDLDIRIRALGQERAENQGLINIRVETQTKLNRVLLQQKQLEARQLQDQIRFEERISNLKREQNVLERTGELLQRAQIAALNQASTITPVIEAQITARADARQINIEKQSIERQLSEIDVRLLAVRQESAAAQTIKKLERDRLNLANELADIELDVIEQRLNAAQSELNAREQVADAEAERFKSISGAANQQIKNLVDSQLRVVELIGQEADKFEEIFELQNEAVETRERSTRGGAVRDISDLNIRQQRNIIQRRNRIILEGAQQASRLLRRQFEELGAIPSFNDLSESAEVLNQQITSTGGVFGQFRDGLDRAARLQLDEISSRRELFDIQRSQTLSAINLQRTAINQESEVARRRINLIEDELQIIQKRIDIEAEIGEKLIKTPDEFLKETRRIFEASNVLRAAGVDSSNVEAALLNVIQRITQITGIEGLQPILEGLQAAESRDQSLIEGVLPGQLTSLFTRLVANPNARLQEQQISEQQKLIGEIGSLITGIQSNNAQLVNLIRKEEAIETLLRRDETPKAQLAELKANVTASRAAALAAISNARSSRANLQNIATQIGTLKTTFDEKILPITQGDKAIVTSLGAVQGLLREIRDAREIDVGGQPTAIVRALGQLSELRQGQVPTELEESFENALAAERSKASRARNPLREEFRDVALQLARLSGLEDELTQLNRDQGDFLLSSNRIGSGFDSVLQILAGRGDFTTGQLELTTDEQVRLADLKTRFAELEEQLRTTAVVPGEFAAKIQASLIESKIKSLEDSLEKGGVDVDKAIKTLGGALGSAPIIDGDINATGKITLSPDTDAAVRESSTRQIVAADKSFLAACEGLIAAERLLNATEEQRVATSNFQETTTKLTSATVALKDIAETTQRVAESQQQGGGSAGISAITAAAIRVQEESASSFRTLIGVDLVEAIGRRIARPGATQDEDILLPGFEDVIKGLGFDINQLAQVAARAGASTREEFRQNLRGALAEEIIDGFERTEQGGAFQNRVLELLGPGVLARQIADAVSQTGDNRPIENRISEARAAGPQALADQAARQLEAMQRLVTLNEQGILNTRTLDEAALQALKDQIAILREQSPAAAAAVDQAAITERVAREQERANTIASLGFGVLDRQFQANSEAIKQQPKETGKEVADANRPIVDGVNKTANSLEQLRTEMTNLFNETSALRQQQAAQHQEDVSQRQQLAGGATARLQIDEASREDFVNLFTDKFNEACQLWVQQFVGAINENPLTVGAAPIELELNASVQTEVTGEEFITQLTEALVGTGLEDKTELIITALAPLLQLELDRSGNITQSGEEVISLGGRTSGTTTNR